MMTLAFSRYLSALMIPSRQVGDTETRTCQPPYFTN